MAEAFKAPAIIASGFHLKGLSLFLVVIFLVVILYSV